VKEDRERVVFLHKVLEGGTDRSYGLQVARMAGVPKGVLSRAAEVLAELEKSEAPLAQTGPQPMQLRLFEAEAPEILKELQGIDPAEMTPIEALTKLDEWKRRFGL
jgi:DNA mismatch repair protein MutS